MIAVPRRRTPVPLAGLAGVLEDAFRQVVVTDPRPEAVALAWAMLALEHGVVDEQLHGVWNYNLGNHDATSADRADGPVFSTVPEREIIAGAETHQVHTRPAYDDAESGAEGYWARLREGYAEAFYVACGVDDPRAGEEQLDLPGRFAAALKRAKYFTDDAAKYAAGVRLWLREYDRRAAQRDAGAD